MTLEEAIKYAEAMKAKIQEKLGRFVNMNGPAVYYSDLAFLSVAIPALMEKVKRENPTPLTLEDLMNMNGEPVWWWNKSCTPICMICVSDRFTEEPMFVNFDFKEEDCTGLTKYKWLMKRGYKPYRTNPKEASK